MDFSVINLSNEDKKNFFSRIEDIYAEMEKRYSIVSGSLNFSCKDCSDNCCYTHFRHHTVIEYLYLMHGVNALDSLERKELVEKAAYVVEETRAAEEANEKIRILCPVNKDGLCMLYKSRLMICRLHGTAHYFDTPKGRVTGPGCYRFEELSKGKRSVAMLDRTDIYRDLAFLEMDVRKTTGVNEKFKYSISEMIAGAF